MWGMAETLGGGLLPVDERQQDADWIPTLHERCDGIDANPTTRTTRTLLSELFSIMGELPFEEQRYRLECISALIPSLYQRPRSLSKRTLERYLLMENA